MDYRFPTNKKHSTISIKKVGIRFSHLTLVKKFTSICEICINSCHFFFRFHSFIEMAKIHKHYRWPPRTTRNIVQVQNDRSYYNIEAMVKNRLKAAPQFVQNLDVQAKLEAHVGCVNCLEWSSNGRLLASGSDDNRLIIWKPFHHKPLCSTDIMTPHQGNIFSVKFLPNTGDSLIATAAADRCCYVFDVNRINDQSSPCWKCSCHTQ